MATTFRVSESALWGTDLWRAWEANARWEYMVSAKARAGSNPATVARLRFSSTLVATAFVTNADGTTCYGARGRGFESRQLH